MKRSKNAAWFKASKTKFAMKNDKILANAFQKFIRSNQLRTILKLSSFVARNDPKQEASTV